MKKILLATLLFLSVFIVRAQKKQNVYFLKNGAMIKDRTSADFIRVIQEPDKGSKLYNLLEFYPDDTEKTRGHVSEFEPKLVYEDSLFCYSKQGFLIEKSFFKKGVHTGRSDYWYDNGNPKMVVLYDPIKNKDEFPHTKLVHFFDSLGVQTVKRGNGYYKDKYGEGSYFNGEKDSIWKGETKNGKYEEEFENGKFITGRATLNDGTVKVYNTEGTPPSYPGGIESFYQYLGRSIQYPEQAQRAGIQGKVFYSFVVEKDGTLVDIEPANRLGFGLEEEGLRILRQSKKWNPGIQHGVPVRVKYNIHINFRLR